jgi:hypothetical protein
VGGTPTSISPNGRGGEISRVGPPALPSSPLISNIEPEQTLYNALLKRGKNGGPSEIKFDEQQEQDICKQVINDFTDSDSSLRPFKLNMLEMMKNWRGTKEQKDFPFVGASNIKVPLTSSFVETMKARLLKAFFGGERFAEIGMLDKKVDTNDIDEMNQWMQWELTETVHWREHFDNIFHNLLITGIGLSVPSYQHDTRFLHSQREFEIQDQKLPLSQIMEEAINKILGAESEWGTDERPSVTDQSKPGIFKLSDGGRIEFSIPIPENPNENTEIHLVADTWRRETIFDGVRDYCANLEDICLVNSGETIEDIPFFGLRQFVSPAKYRERLDDDYFINWGKEENTRIISMADIKVGDFIEREQTKQQDFEEGTDSTDSSSNTGQRQWLEIYRWEGWWSFENKDNEDYQKRLIEPAQQYVVWVVPRAMKILRIKRVEDLNKDGKRSAIKHDFIKEPNRFLSMGLAEWVHNSQAEMDAIHNQRLDAGLLTNVPFGFYKPTAGIKGQVIKIEPGKLFPVADPQGVNFPKTNWMPTFSFQEEQLVKRYAGEQGGLTDPAIGQFTSKRQSASEFVGTANALDLRTEQIVEGLIRTVREELYRILGLYQQYGPRVRIFRAGGEGGVELTKQFEKSRLQGKLLLRLTANVQQANEQLQRQLAQDMLGLLLNEFLIQMGIVGPDTIYHAIKKLAKLSHYTGVPIHQPQMPPISESPQVENHQMFMEQAPSGPNMTENFAEHLQIHGKVAADQKVIEKWSPKARQMLQEHIQETLKTQNAKQLLNQQRAMLAIQMRMGMEQQGIRPGKSGGQRPGNNTGPGTKDEGVRGAGGGQGAPSPGKQ